MRRKYLTFAVLAALCVAFALSAVIRTRSSPASEYDPWMDVDDNGIVNMLDLYDVTLKYGTTGTPLTKASINYDSGWLNITDKCGQYFNVTHGLNSTDLMLDITGKTTPDGGPHQRYIGLTNYVPGWSKTYGGTGADGAGSLVQTRDGGYALAGATTSWGAGGYDFWLVKTDASGNQQWSKTYGGTGDDSAGSLVQTGDGGYAMSGTTYSFGAGSNDIWLVRTDSESGLAWTSSTANTITLYRGATDPWWNFVRVQIWQRR